jgi:hypothetical protein
MVRIKLSKQKASDILNGGILMKNNNKKEDCAMKLECLAIR